MAGDADPTLVRDAMLTRMAMATPGGPMFRYDGPHAFPRMATPPGFPKVELANKVPVHKHQDFDEAQAYAAGRKGLIAHTALMRLLAQAAVTIREQLAAGEPVIIVSGGRELMRLEP